ncbi:hypothetical protein GGC64_002425 [Mycobacterium sp. OAS707]|uniref:hypothetical protein n=1 Tax=Mycobacterium sp. OAS707 TaxID=2663822 RepID=UPI00178990B6|nr:hypothetical protein [Mycobacterium sp. OAS707]MBE1548401.1 hypothetical protein [Mycobacterium sp. OAS707]
MGLSKFVSAAMIVGALGFGVIGPGGAVASADPVAPAPLKPHDDFCPPWCGDGNGRGNGHGNGNGNGNGNYCPPWCGNNGADWNGDKGPWWANNRHDWWDDRNGPPPWGWGPPPAFQWDGGPPHPFNYWGYNVNPVWDNGFGQWGIWLFGLWIPIFGIGVQ